MDNSNSNDKKYDLIKIYEDFAHERDHQPPTKVSYRKVINTFTKNTSITRVDQITKEVILLWRDAVVERSSKSTFNSYRRHLLSILNYCVEIELIENNPIQKVKQYTHVGGRKKGCSKKDLNTLIHFLRNDWRTLSYFFLMIVVTLYFTGIRRSQLCGLIWHDIDFKENLILLRKTHSKSRKEWKIPLHSELRPYLLDMKMDTMEQFEDFREDDQIFMVQRYSSEYVGDRLLPDQLTGIMRRISTRSGVKISAHMIRHLVATLLSNRDDGEEYRNGEIPHTLNGIQEFLGHANIATTIAYIEPSIALQRKVIKSLDLKLEFEEMKKRKS
ncbi:MAG: site-specific integrase [Gammaproteobacteria bacterium]|nr:site-specific integrase [Gammaproteobacteria bacterium]